MAFSAVTALGSAVRATAGSSTSGTVSANIVVGRLLVIACSTKNDQTTVGASTDHTSITDAAGNTWTKRSEYTNSAGAADDGTTVSVWTSVISTQINSGGTLTVNHGSNSDGIITFTEVTLGSSSVGVAQAATATAISATLAGMTSREYLLFAAYGAEGSDQAKTPDGDYAERFDLRSRNNAAATTIHVQTRIATLTGDTCTSTAWTNTEPVAILLAIWEDAQAVTAPTLATGNSRYAPTVAPGAVAVTLSTVASGHALSAIAVQGALRPWTLHNWMGVRGGGAALSINGRQVR